jgi:hypothetical protein
MNSIESQRSTNRTSARLAEAIVALSPAEVDILIDALARYRSPNWSNRSRSEAIRSVAKKACTLRDRLLCVRDAV